MSESIIPPTEKRSLRYDLKATEVHDLSLQLANKTKERLAMEEEKKSVTSQYKAKLDEITATCNKLSNQVVDGYEFREVDCAIEYHKPVAGKKILTRSDTQVQIIETMTTWEHNLFNQQSDVSDSDMITEEKEKLRGRKKDRKNSPFKED